MTYIIAFLPRFDKEVLPLIKADIADIFANDLDHLQAWVRDEQDTDLTDPAQMMAVLHRDQWSELRDSYFHHRSAYTKGDSIILDHLKTLGFADINDNAESEKLFYRLQDEFHTYLDNMVKAILINDYFVPCDLF